MTGKFTEQGSQALVFLFGGGTEPSISPNPAQSLGEDMLEEPCQELKGRKFGCFLFAGFGAPVLEGDEAAVFVELTFGADGGAVDVT